MCPAVACFRNREPLRMPPTVTLGIKHMNAPPTSTKSTTTSMFQKLRWLKLDRTRGSHSEKQMTNSKNAQSQTKATKIRKNTMCTCGMDL
jgi:hypothetical protein